MKTLLSILLLVMTTLASPAALPTEAEALVTLGSSASLADKEAACRRLKEIGSAKSVATLRSLVADPNLAQWAVDALQTIPAREADEALLRVLPETTGPAQALVVFALGVRRDPVAVKPLSQLLSGSDVGVATAAAKALGKIEGDASLAALQAARVQASGAVHLAVVDSLLARADHLRAQGQVERANAIYTELRTASETPQVRAAAFRGQVLCAGNRHADLIGAALTGCRPEEQSMALQLVRDLTDAGLTSAFAVLLPKLSPLPQIAMLQALRQRNDPDAAEAVAALTRSQDTSVRIAALRALGDLGDAGHVTVLAELATSLPAGERQEAQEALLALHRGPVLETMLAAISEARPAAQLELVRALGRRMDRRAIPELLRQAAGSDPKLGAAAIQALERLSTEEQVKALLGLITDAADDARREAAISAYVAVGGRGRNATAFSTAALIALKDVTPGNRCGLLEAAGTLGGPGVLQALRAALGDAEADVRATALRMMAEHAGDDARPDLLRLARELPSEDARAQALQGYWRLVEAMNTRPQPERLAAVREGFAVARTTADLRLGLARLAELEGEPALELAQSHRSNDAVRAEAETAVFQIASRSAVADLEAAEKAFLSLASSASSERIRNEAQAALTKLEERKGCIALWLVSGPYRQEGKQGGDLFDVRFAPEEGRGEWRALAGDGRMIDLLPVAGGNHCVVYLKARVFCPQAQTVALEIGSDDGVRLWLNGAPRHANNAARSFTTGEDKVTADLKEGWNDFLLKITQHTAGCAASVRIRTPEGKPIPGLRMEAKL